VASVPPNRLECTARRLLGAFLAAVSVISGSFILAACGTPAIAEKAVGWWQETGTPQSYRLHITWIQPRWKESQQYERDYEPYDVFYQRAGAFNAYLKGGRLLAWGQNPWSINWTLAYDQASDRLMASDSMHHRFILTRVNGQP
jgi:hypothetical protein